MIFSEIMGYDWMTSDICSSLFFVVNSNDVRCIQNR
jgi:hypothetical protein